MKIFFQLIKVTVTIPVTFLAFFGHWLGAGSIQVSSIWVCIGVFMLAGAASAFNQIIEKNHDARMLRTQKRPLPSGKISPKKAIAIALTLSVLGSIVLIKLNIYSFLLGLLTLVWYLGVYTLIKRKTGFAVIPGSLTGALPPLIGFAAAGGDITNHQILFLSILVFIWQIPHFWLLMLIYGDDYKQAGYPTLFDVFEPFMVRLWTLGWITAAFIIFFLNPLFHFNLPESTKLLIPFICLLLLCYAGYLMIFKPGKKTYKTLFHTINLLMLIALFLLVKFN